MMKPLSLASVSLLVLALTGCTVMPTGPSVTVLPGSTKSFEQFRYDDVNCRQYAHMQGNSQSAGYGSQRGYDSAYVQCMYARGHQVPVYGRMLTSPGAPGPGYAAPMAPPPPPGYWRRY
jgi:hypothetical protein